LVTVFGLQWLSFDGDSSLTPPLARHIWKQLSKVQAGALEPIFDFLLELVLSGQFSKCKLTLSSLNRRNQLGAFSASLFAEAGPFHFYRPENYFSSGWGEGQYGQVTETRQSENPEAEKNLGSATAGLTEGQLEPI
jgi:hypothetical protein